MKTVEKHTPTADDKAAVMLLGVFHFGNPQKDLVQTNQINVMTAESQHYLEELTDRLSQFQPTVVLLEFNPAHAARMGEEYGRYLNNDLALPPDEVYQLGFRIAKKSALTAVHSFDERTIAWQAEPMLDYIKAHDPITQAKFEAILAQISHEIEQAHATLSLAELLLDANLEEKDTLNKSLYLLTNQVGAGDQFEGAEATASWWHRNFRMYANIQQYAGPGERVLAIGGQGHMAILKDLLKIDQERDAVDVRPYL